jgi:hypothetical protein
MSFLIAGFLERFRSVSWRVWRALRDGVCGGGGVCVVCVWVTSGARFGSWCCVGFLVLRSLALGAAPSGSASPALPESVKAASGAPSKAPVPAGVQIPPWARLSVLDNGQVRVGVDLAHGGALVFLSRDGGENRINNFDFGRQVQMAFYSGPVPFSFAGQVPAPHWSHLGWNPVQTGDDFRNASRLLAHENDGRTLHVRCEPLQWPLRNVPGECTFDLWLELEGPVVKARARLENARGDTTQYPARLQELPAAYANASFHRVVSYTGARPFEGEPIQTIPKSNKADHPWTQWLGTEGWSALLDERDSGLGLLTPGRIWFTGGFAGQPGPNDPMGNDVGYLAGHGLEILDHNLNYEYRFELVPGFLREIRERAERHRRVGLPVWRFEGDRQGWSYQRAKDTGWPLKGHLHVLLEEGDPQLWSPPTFWQAEEAPYLEVEAALQSASARSAQVFWKTLEPGPSGAWESLTFPIQPDGEFHRYRVRLADSPRYRGALVGLRWDPVPQGAPGDWVKIRSIRLAGEEPEVR